MTLGKFTYPIARTALFRLNPELAHDVALGSLKKAERLGLLRLIAPCVIDRPVDVMGLRFKNPCGLSAGLDKNGDYIDALGKLGFGFIEIGTITPLPQDGNPKPRMFRLPAQQALINRLGFNNKGVEYLVDRVKNRRWRGILGINIGKNKNTPNERAIDDYITCLRQVYSHADYITVNISSPNTEGLRALQHGEALSQLITDLKSEQEDLAAQHNKAVPMAIKLAPDLDPEAVSTIAAVLNQLGVDAVIAGNTTITRPGLEGSKYQEESGGLSGAPLKSLADQTFASLRAELDDRIPMIGVGGITRGQDAVDKVALGADLVQVYTGFIYHGPQLIADVVDALQ